MTKCFHFRLQFIRGLKVKHRSGRLLLMTLSKVFRRQYLIKNAMGFRHISLRILVKPINVLFVAHIKKGLKYPYV